MTEYRIEHTQGAIGRERNIESYVIEAHTAMAALRTFAPSDWRFEMRDADYAMALNPEAQDAFSDTWTAEPAENAETRGQ